MHALLAGGGFENANATGDLDIYKTLTIRGAGPSTIIVSSFQDRVLDVQAGVSVLIHDLEIRNGFVQDYGGAIRNSGQVRLERVRLWNNSGWSGGAIRNGDPGAEPRGRQPGDLRRWRYPQLRQPDRPR